MALPEPESGRTPRRLAAVGGKSALEALYLAERLHMVRLALLLVDDLPTAEDVVQDAFSAVVHAWPELGDDGAVRAYLRTCAGAAPPAPTCRRCSQSTPAPTTSPSWPSNARR
jgi:predicted RNA polymerase sigma factor